MVDLGQAICSHFLTGVLRLRITWKGFSGTCNKVSIYLSDGGSRVWGWKSAWLSLKDLELKVNLRDGEVEECVMGMRLRTVFMYYLCMFVSACLYGHYVQAVPLEARRGRWCL